MVEVVRRRPAVFTGLMLLVIVIPLWLRGTKEPAGGEEPQTVSNAALEVVLLRLGLWPEHLAASGFQGNATGVLITHLRQALGLEPQALPQADHAFAEAKREADRLERLVRSGQASPKDVAAHQAAQTALASARAARDLVLAGLFASATASASEARPLLSSLAAHRRLWEIGELPLCSVSRSQAEWVALRDALAAERIAASYGDELASELVSLLAKERAEVSGVRTALETNLPSVLQAWQSALAD